MCDHRVSGRHGRLWTVWASAALGSFTVLEVYGLITEGPDATLSTYLRRRAGLLEPCAHSTLGRAVILAFAGWLAAHLGWGRVGLPRRAFCGKGHTSC
jgi:hypothetical protein